MATRIHKCSKHLVDTRKLFQVSANTKRYLSVSSSKLQRGKCQHKYLREIYTFVDIDNFFFTETLRIPTGKFLPLGKTRGIAVDNIINFKGLFYIKFN